MGQGQGYRVALGCKDRLGDWIESMERAVAARPWRAVVEEWAPRLAPGIVGAAGHGWIRTAHAVRSLGRVDNRRRRIELAHGLAYWAAAYVEVPTQVDSAAKPLRPGECLATLPLLPQAHRLPRGKMTERLRPLDEFVAFRRAVGTLDMRGPLEATVDELLDAAADYYAGNVASNRIVAIHAVTMPCALRSMLAVTSEAVGRELVEGAWRAVAAFASAYGVERGRRVIESAASFEREALITRAIEARSAHTLKLLDGCLLEVERRGASAFRDVGVDVIARYEAQR